MKKIATLIILIICATAQGQQSDYDRLKAEAEKFYNEKSYARAVELYEKAGALKLSPADARWVDFRRADSLWRAEAATNNADTMKLDQAREKLKALVQLKSDADAPDLVSAEAEESLGDFWWTRRNAQNWGEAWPHYQKALDWWAGERDVDTARERYLQIVWKAVAPPWVDSNYYPGSYGGLPSLEVLENALRIAQRPEDKSRAHFYLAVALRQYGEWEQRQRVPTEFEAALQSGKSSDWYDDALYLYGEWLASTGRITQTDDGQWQQQPDYVRALELFRRVITEYKKGETRYYDDAQQQIANITNPTVALYISNIFLPDSEIQFTLTWRNVRRVDLSVYRIDLNRDVRFTDKDQNSGNWSNQINLAGREKVKSWSREIKDDGTFKPGQEALRLDQRLPVGAYVIEARSGGASARDVLLITDATLVLKTSGQHALVYFCQAISGVPFPRANIRLWEKSYNSKTQQWSWRETSGTTNADGLAIFDLTSDNNYSELFVSAGSDERQAFSLGNNYSYARNQQPWRIYAFTDRPAYRPQETVQWKLIARMFENSVYSTPANRIVEYEIQDPRGTKVSEGKAALNNFGSAWGKLELTDAMPLGAYKITFYDEGRQHNIGSANLFRLEEYKLPEFKVSVQTPVVDGKKRAFRLGEKIEATVNADYYFGGAVAGAEVEVLVYQRPFYHYWNPPREYPWYYTDLTPQPYSYYGGQPGEIIKRETLKTNGAGKATLVFDTPRSTYQDMEYTIEARVTDASRREITGSDTVRVTRQRYYVYPRSEHNLYRPNDKVQINIKSLDANDQPVEVTGQVKVTRDYYYEIWIDPAGREIKGEELKRVREDARTRGAIFPPLPPKGGKGWTLKFRGYQHEDILTQSLKTDQQGEATLNFTPDREGYYRVNWTSPDKGGPVVQAETAAWVTTERTTELGYRHGGVEVIVDRDTFVAGQRAPVMLNADASDRYVLFSIEGDDLYSYQLVHLTGTSKLIEVPVEEKHIPNVFLSAAMVSERQLFVDTKQVIVPPSQHFLNVEVKPDRAHYQPRDEGILTVTTRDREGKPVAAEVALGLIDESLFYIQRDTTPDLRQFYFGTKRAMQTRLHSTFQMKPYAKLLEGADKQLIDELVLEQRRSKDDSARESDAPFNRLEMMADLSKPAGTLTRSGANAYSVNGAMAGRASDEASQFKAEFGAADGNLPVNGRRIDNLSMLSPGVAGAAPAPGQEPAVQVRNDFRSTVIWQPDVITDGSGTAIVKVKYPDSLTSWKATARAVTASDSFGVASADSLTQKPLIVRLQAPRFFVNGDSVVVSALIDNNGEQMMRVTPSLDASGVIVKGLMRDGKLVQSKPDAIDVPARGESRVDWSIKVLRPGDVKLRVTARGDKEADAMERDFTAYEHGIEKFVSRSGKLRGDEVTMHLNIPAERKPETTNLMVQVAPSMAVTMLDALPYLVDYPYGCTEQTMSRFLPAAITAKTLKDLGLSPEAALGRVFGGIEPESAAATHPEGKRHLDQLNNIVKQSLERLYSMQHADGGWGWWKDDQTDRFMTAYVLWGLTLARDAGVEVKPDAAPRAWTYLNDKLVEEENNPDMQAWMLHAISTFYASSKTRTGGPAEITDYQRKAFDNLWTNRDRLNAYTRALLALSAHHFGYADKAQTLIRNLENGVRIDRAPDTSVVQRGAQESGDTTLATAHWGEDGIFYRWSDGGIEATAFALRALLAIDPQNKLIEPVTNWLIKNRRGAQWSNTRDTAITVLALNDYLRSAGGELKPDLEYELSVNGNIILNKRLTALDALSAPSQFVIDAKYIRDGANEIRIRRKSGNSPLYFAAQARFFSLEEPIKAAGNEIFVRREYYKLVGHPTLLKGYAYERLPLRDGETVTSGDRVEVVVTIEAKNNYEYLLFEDLKPAGLESVRIRSGEPLNARELKSGAVERKFSVASSGEAHHAAVASSLMDQNSGGDGTDARNYTGRAAYVYQELRDRKIALFLSKLPQGVWEIRYDLRAEAPGAFHALPMLGQAMYVPEIRCNDEEVRIKVEDKNNK
jgi:uncharacterized protein YfaS (alpha-2-macroglobulin family)